MNTRTVTTRPTEDGKFQYGLVREGRPVLWCAGSYVSAAAAVKAAERRVSK